MVVVLLLSCVVFFPAAGQKLLWFRNNPYVTATPTLTPTPTLPPERQVWLDFPTLPPVPTRHDIAARRPILQALVRATSTEPLELPTTVATAVEEDEEDTRRSRPRTTYVTPTRSPPPLPPSRFAHGAVRLAENVPEDRDWAPTQSSRTLQLLNQLKTLPKLKALQSWVEASAGDDPWPLHRLMQPPPSPPAIPLRPRLPPKQQLAASENLSPPAEEMDEGVLLRQEDVADLLTTRSDSPVPSVRKLARRPSQRASPIAEMIELVLYINQNEHRFQRTKIEKEITRVFLKEDRIEVLRVLGEKREDAILAQLLSHVSALSIACESQRSVLVLEDTFKFYVTRNDLQDHLRLAQRALGDRWNVIVFGPTVSEWAPVSQGQANDIQLMRILQGSFMTGYLVNRTYLPALLNLMIEHIYLRYPDTTTPGTASSDLQQQLHQLQRSDVWIGFQSPLGGTRNETLDEIAAFSGSEEKSSWTIQKHGVYIKASVSQISELNNLLRHLYLERYKGHRLFVAVHHPPGQKLAHRHKRSFSSTFYEGVQYFSDPSDVATYLQEFDGVQWIDLTTWCQSEDAIARLIRLLDDTTSESESSGGDDDRSPEELISVASSECTIPCLNAHQRHKILTP